MSGHQFPRRSILASTAALAAMAAAPAARAAHAPPNPDTALIHLGAALAEARRM